MSRKPKTPSDNPYSPVAFRGNPNKLRGLLSQIRLLGGNLKRRDGDILEQVLAEEVERLKQSHFPA